MRFVIVFCTATARILSCGLIEIKNIMRYNREVALCYGYRKMHNYVMVQFLLKRRDKSSSLQLISLPSYRTNPFVWFD